MKKKIEEKKELNEKHSKEIQIQNNKISELEEKINKLLDSNNNLKNEKENLEKLLNEEKNKNKKIKVLIFRLLFIFKFI